MKKLTFTREGTYCLLLADGSYEYGYGLRCAEDRRKDSREPVETKPTYEEAVAAHCALSF